MESAQREKSDLTLWQRFGLRRLRKLAGRKAEEPLRPEDWEAVMRLHRQPIGRVAGRLFLALPSSPRCGTCGAPFAGAGRFIVGPLGHRPSRKNPTICATCVELSPPGGMTTQTGILFADIRGSTARFDGRDPEQVSIVLRRFYRCAEDVLFPDAVIDKLIGDEVMALYLPEIKPNLSLTTIPTVMLEHARALLRAVGYGSGTPPFVEVGIGLDFGEAFVGNIGQRALYDFTAVGDVVNTAARLQAQAAGGEIVLSDRVADGLPTPVGSRVQLTLKGKREPQTAYRVSL
jgi:adenylate cyclase